MYCNPKELRVICIAHSLCTHHSQTCRLGDAGCSRGIIATTCSNEGHRYAVSVHQQMCARSVKCLLCHHPPCMVRAATMLVGEGAVQGPLGGVWSERRVSCVLAADVLATGTEWRQTTHQSRKKRSIGSQEGTIIRDLPFGFPINNIIHISLASHACESWLARGDVSTCGVAT